MEFDVNATVENLIRHAATGNKDLAILQGYQFVKLLGVGGMGGVCLLEHGITKIRSAIKVMRPDVWMGEADEERFRREISILASLDHKNIVKLQGAGAESNSVFYLMEYCNGGTLDSRLQSKFTLPLDEALNIEYELLDALEYAHYATVPDIELADGTVAEGVGIVHRDLKPLNIFFKKENSDQILKLGDLGLGKAYLLASLTKVTNKGEAIGTPQYMCRQQLSDFKYAKPEVDIWAAAACLYRMLTGFTPRDFPPTIDPWSVVQRQTPIKVSERDATIPSKIALLLDEALDDTSALRFQSVKDFRDNLIIATHL